MAHTWFVRNKKDGTVFGPYPVETIKTYMTQNQLTKMHELSADKITWIECQNWKKDTQRKNLGKYQIIRELGRGGMGVVYLAIDPQSQKHYALKVLFFQDDDYALQRFSNEAKAISQLEHSYIIKIHDIYTKPCCFFAMEYVPGVPFSDYLLLTGLTLEKKLKTFLYICEAIHYSHSQKIIHRDLKPENIIIRENGRPVIIDFGIAKNIKDSSKLTKTGDIFGTPKYMSPEAVEGSDLDERSDVYSLGVIFYEILTGRVPFEGDSFIEVLFQLTMGEAIPPSRLNKSIKKDGALEVVCLRALEKDSTKRIPNAYFFKKEIENILTNKPIKLKPKSKVEKFKILCAKHLAIMASIALLFATLLITSIMLFKAKQETEERQKIAEKNLIFSKKKIIHNILQTINEQKYSSDVFSDYLKINQCYKEFKELLDIKKLFTKDEFISLKKIQEKIKNHLKFLVLPDFPHTQTKKILENAFSVKLSGSGKYITQLNTNGYLYVWEAVSKGFDKESMLKIFKLSGGDFSFSQNDEYIIYRNEQRNVCVYNFTSKEQFFFRNKSPLFFSQFTADNNYIVLGFGKKKSVQFEIYDLIKKTSHYLSFQNVHQVKISADSKLLLIYQEVVGYFMLYAFKAKTIEKKYPNLKLKYSIFFNQTGQKIFLFNMFGVAIYDVKKDEFQYSFSAYERARTSPINVGKNAFVLVDKEEGLVLAEEHENTLLYKGFMKYNVEKISKLLFAPSNFLGILQNHRFEIRDCISKNIIITIKHKMPVKSALLKATKKGLSIQLVTNSNYKKYEIFFEKLPKDKNLTIMTETGLAQKIYIKGRTLALKNLLVYTGVFGFAVWRDGNLISSVVYKYSDGYISGFEMNAKTKTLYVLHERKKIIIYDLEQDKRRRFKIFQKPKRISKIGFSYDYKYLYIATESEGFFRKNIENPSKTEMIPESLNNVSAITSTKNGHLIIGLDSGNVRIFTSDLKEIKINVKEKIKHSSISVLSICESKKLLIIADENGMITIWQNYNAPKLLRTMQTSIVGDISFSPNGKYMSLFKKNHLFIYVVKDLLSEEEEINKFEIYAGHHKSSAAFTEDWSKVYFFNNDGYMLAFKQPYFFNEKNLKDKISECDKALEESLINFDPLLPSLEEIDKILNESKNAE